MTDRLPFQLETEQRLKRAIGEELFDSYPNWQVRKEGKTMERFTWTKVGDYGKRGPIFYESDKLQILEPHKKEFMWCQIETRVNGRNTAVAIIHWSVEWVTAEQNRWGTSVYRHFRDSKQAGNKARAWCNYWLNNPPYSFNPFKGCQKPQDMER